MSAVTTGGQDSGGIAAALEAELGERWPQVLFEQPPEGYIAALGARSGPGSYRHVGDSLRSWCADLRARPGGDAAMELYHRIVLARVVDQAAASIDALALPPSILELVRVEHARIVQELQAQRRNFYLHENDAFAKDLALASLRLVPCGVELVDLNSGIPRSLAFAGGALQALGMARVALRSGGFRPWFESHWDRRRLAEFTSQGYDGFYRRVADLLETHPQARGLIGSSWWFDPAVADISPELAFLSATPMANGAHRFRVGINEVATRDALRFARERSRRHAAGAYQPCVFMIVWERRSLLAWARRTA